MHLCAREEEPSIKDFRSNRIVDYCWTEKERHLKSRPHNYPAKKHSLLNSAEHVDLSTLTMANLENRNNEEGLSL